MTQRKNRYWARVYRWLIKKELEEGIMVSAPDCAENQRKCRRGIYERIEEMTKRMVPKWVFILIVTALIGIGSSVLGYSLLRSNGKASKEDLQAAEARLQAVALETRHRAQSNTEQARAIETRQMAMAEDIKETKDDVKKILDRLPSR